jgi:hypothetical protein
MEKAKNEIIDSPQQIPSSFSPFSSPEISLKKSMVDLDPNSTPWAKLELYSSIRRGSKEPC